MSVLRAIFLILCGLVRGRAALALKNLALRQQLAVLWCSRQRPSPDSPRISPGPTPRTWTIGPRSPSMEVSGATPVRPRPMRELLE